MSDTKSPDALAQARLWKQIVKAADPAQCWPWTGSRTDSGYGRFYWEGGSHIASRIVYTLCVGPIPKGKCVLHTCDFPLCCNPAHLFVGTKRDNNLDMIAKKRQARGKRHGNRLRKYWSQHPERHYPGKPPRKIHDAETKEKMRADYELGMSQRAIAKKYGLVSQGAVSYILNRAKAA